MSIAQRLLYYNIIMAYRYQRRHRSQKATDDYGQGQRLGYGPVLVDCFRRFFQRFRYFLKQTESVHSRILSRRQP